MNESVFESFNKDDLLIPQDNSTVKMSMYWIVKDGKVFRHKQTKVWQCNKHKEIAEKVIDSYPGCTVEYLSFAYVPKE